MGDYLKLLGILIVILGFVLHFDTISVILLSAFTTGLLAHMSFIDILNTLGSSFITSRYMLLFILAIPIIGVLEKNGLREHSFTFIKEKIKKSTPGSIMSIYTLFRMLTLAMGAMIGGVVQMIRPLVYPMILGSIKNKYNKDVTVEVDETIKSYATLSENMGNFFAQNIFLGSGGLLLVVGVLKANSINVTPLELAKVAVIPAVIAFILTVIRFTLLDIQISKKMK